jgi:hypothetical protein
MHYYKLSNDHMAKLSKKEQRKYLDKWIKAIAKNKKTTELSIRRHIVRHAKETISKTVLESWSASMRNLIEIYEFMHGIKPSLLRQIERLENKYKMDSNRYTPPPKK